MERQAKCINGFSVEMCDDNGFSLENEYMTIEEDSVWYVSETDFRVIGGEVRLLNEEYGWIEIPKEQFETDFMILN